MIDHSRKRVIISPPKTGTTTLINHHWDTSNRVWPTKKNHIMPVPIDYKGYNYYKLPGHISYREALNICPKVKDYSKICVCRNPYDRFVSMYFHLKAATRNWVNIGRWIGMEHWLRDCDFNKFVDFYFYFLSRTDNDLFLETSSKCNVRKTYQDISAMMPTQWAFHKTEENTLSAEKVYRFENFEEIVKDLNISKNKKHLNISKNKPKTKKYQDYYNRDTKTKIYKYYEEDLDMFNYTF